MPPLTDMPDRGMAKMKEQSLRFAFEVLFIPEAQEIMAKAYLTNEGIRKKIDHVAGLFEAMFHQGAKYERLRHWQPEVNRRSDYAGSSNRLDRL